MADRNACRTLSSSDNPNMAENKPEFNPFVIEEAFPDPASVLRTFHPPVTSLASTCLFALDANVLLATYLLGGDGLKDVEKHFRQLVTAERLFLPAQAVREFARHRPKYVAQAFEGLTKVTAACPPLPKDLDVPVFANLPEYEEVKIATKEVRRAIIDYKAKVEKLVSAGRYINDNDAVSRFYGELFSSDQVIGHGMSRPDLLKDLAYRALHDIPPGFKDKGKGDGGSGDVAIWHSLLKLARDRKRDVVFVSNDVKPDWVVGVDKDKPFGPRPELVEEFARSTGQQFNIVQFKTFLSLIGSKPETIRGIEFSFPIRRPRSTAQFLFSEPVLERRDPLVNALTLAAQLQDTLNNAPVERLYIGDTGLSWLNGIQVDLTALEATAPQAAIERIQLTRDIISFITDLNDQLTESPNPPEETRLRLAQWVNKLAENLASLRPLVWQTRT